jgi:hypothetical protein
MTVLFTGNRPRNAGPQFFRRTEKIQSFNFSLRHLENEKGYTTERNKEKCNTSLYGSHGGENLKILRK